MAIIASSTANSSHHHLQTFNSESNNNNHLRDYSFSSYLNNSEGKTFVEKFTESGQNFNPIISSRKDPLHQGEKKEEDGEIGVFEAEKYFNEGEAESPRVSNMAAKKYQYQKEGQTDLATRKYKVHSGTPSVRSESSWNSQSALLQSGMRNNSSKNRKKKVLGKSFLAGLGWKCSCSDKNSVDISDHADEISFNKTSSATYGVVVHGKKTTPKNPFNAVLDSNHNSVKPNKPQAAAEFSINKNVYFQKPEKLGLAFPTVNSGLGNQLIKMQLHEEEKPRKSLEVFGSPILDKKSKSLSFDKRLTMPSWDSAPKMEEDIGNYNDAESDASSDLFEIESLTGKNNPFLARQTSAVVVSGCVSPTNGYAPSEASIEWSVVTASAAECSVMSDGEEQRSVATIRSPIRTSFASKTKHSEEIQRRRSSILLGCKSHKAVRVAGDAFTTIHDRTSSISSNSQIRHRSDNFTQVTRLQAETKHGAKHGQYVYNSPSMQRSHSPRALQLLYI